MPAESSSVEHGSVLVISGPPGSGKSTVAPLLAQRLGALAVCIDADWFWTTIKSGFIEPWRPESDRQNRAVLRAVTAAAAELATDGYQVVIEGVVGPRHLPTAISFLHEMGIDVDYVVLRPTLATCLARAEARSTDPPRTPGHPPLAASGPIRMLWEQFGALGPWAAHELDTTGLGQASTVEKVMDLRAAGRLRVGRNP